MACVPPLPYVPALHVEDPLVARVPGNAWVAVSCYLTSVI